MDSARYAGALLPTAEEAIARGKASGGKKKDGHKYDGNSRCLEVLRWWGWRDFPCQSYNAITGKKNDLWGLFDKHIMGRPSGTILTATGLRISGNPPYPFSVIGGIDDAVLAKEKRFIGVQLCQAGDKAAHVKKMQASPNLAEWKECGGLAMLMWSTKIGGRWEVHYQWM